MLSSYTHEFPVFPQVLITLPVDAVTFNPSLLLQCRALGLRATQTRYRDPRVKAVVGINPVASAVFGSQGIGEIALPVMLIAGSDDVVTPPRSEQVPPFRWLTARERYFGWIEGGTHFSAIEQLPHENRALSTLTKSEDPAPLKNLLKAQEFFIGKYDEQAKQYIKASSLAFFQTHLAGNPDYGQFLTLDFASLLSRGKELKFSLVQDLD